MLKIRLLVTTALIGVSSISFAAAQSAKISNIRLTRIAIAAASEDDLATTPDMRTTVFGHPGRDRNMDFLCTYGDKVYYSAHANSGYQSMHWQHYAVPIRGKGLSVGEIMVTDSPSAGSSNVTVGIYDDENGKPGNLIVEGTGRAKGSCRLTTVVIAKTFLAAGTKYWVEEEALQRGRGTNAVSWGYNPNAKHNAYYQYYSFSSSSGTSSSYLSDWLPVSGPAPFVKVK